MSTWFVSRHPGALAWAQSKTLSFDHHCAHIDPQQVQDGDVVIGSLPVNLAAAVCQRGAQYVNLTVNLPAQLRGQELSLAQMQDCDAKLEAYNIQARPWAWPLPLPARTGDSLALMARLPLLQLQVQARNVSLQPPQNMGSAWHGALGKVLHDTEPQAYCALYGSANATGARPYVLRPPCYDESLAVDAPFAFSLLLMGDGVHHAQAVCDALDVLSVQGVGPGRGRFVLDTVIRHPISLPLSPLPIATQDITLQLCTPTLLKQDNQHLKQAPSMLLLLKRIIGRVQGLLPAHAAAEGVPADVQRHLLQLAAPVACEASTLSWHNTPRYSARQKAWMPFGGLCGSIRYLQVPPELQLWLQWAQWLHIGNKTTFGHGQIRVCPDPDIAL